VLDTGGCCRGLFLHLACEALVKCRLLLCAHLLHCQLNFSVFWIALLQLGPEPALLRLARAPALRGVLRVDVAIVIDPL
jgi:hypothetical protein